MNKNIFKRILNYLFPYKRHFIIGSIFAFIFSITNSVTLYSVIPIFDTLTPGEAKYNIQLNKEEIEILNKERLTSVIEKAVFIKVQLMVKINSTINKLDKFDFIIYIFISLFFIILLRIVFKLLSVYYIGYAGYAAIRDIRQSFYQSLLQLPLTFFHNHKTGDLISKIIYGSDLISGSLSNQLRKFVVNIFIVITHIALLVYINAELTFMAFISLIIITIPILIMGRSFKKYTIIEQEKIADISSIVNETIEGIKIIKMYQMENFQIKRFINYATILFNKKIKKHIIDIGRPHIIEILASFFLAFLFIYGGGKTLSGEYSKGEFLFFVFTFLFLMNPIKQIANMNNQVKQAEAAGEVIFEIIDLQKEDYKVNIDVFANRKEFVTPQEKDFLLIPKSKINFENISFKYPSTEKLILKNINFSIEAGKTIAIVGRSGVGKTTLMDLLSRFYDPTEGAIYIDDTDIKSVPLNRIRNSIGIVTQEIFLFNGTIAENIAYGHADIPFEEIVEAAKTANAHDFINKMPDNYNSGIGEKGIMLSGGERQRIAIARSILRNPPILILDEATSSLDTESERLVQDALNKLMKSRSSFVIAHRFSTIIKSDLILVIEDSSISEIGTHDELIKKNGIYKKLYEIQFNGV